jgi:hypothetical protein
MFEINIPDAYLWMTEGSKNRKQQFIKYVTRYIKKSYPELELVEIRGMRAICKKRGIENG